MSHESFWKESNVLVTGGASFIGSHIVEKLVENKLAKAMDKFKHAEEISPKLPKLHMQIARGYMLLGKWEDAERAYLKELEIMLLGS